jgi:ribosomal protein L22
MAIFGFGKKEKKQEQAAPGLPVDQVMALRQRGMSNDQIIPEMERQGYNSSQIFDALNQVNISGQGFEQPPTMNAPQQNFPQEQPFTQAQPHYEQPQQKEEQVNEEQIEEIAEAIIDEKWKEFEQDVRIIINWKEKTEAKINRFEQQITDLTNSLNNLHKSLLSKISAYDKNIMDVGTEMKAMEKVFQKVLPSLTENVNKLDRITKSSKLNRK